MLRASLTATLMAALMIPAAGVALPQNPPYFPYPAREDITVEDCIPGAIAYLKNPYRGNLVLPGERVLIVTDRSVDPMSAEAFYVAAWRLGAKSVDVLTLQGRLDITDPKDVTVEQVLKDWWPQWVWDAAAAADRVLGLTFLDRVHVMHSLPGIVKEWEIENNTKFNMLWFVQNRERLATSARFPWEIQNAIVEKMYETLKGVKNLRMTDPNGTDLTWTFDDVTWPRYLAAFGDRPSSHAPRMHLASPPNMRGVFVSTKTHPGMIPRLEMRIEGGRIVELTGGGSLGDHMREAFEKYKDIHYPGFPGPGINWVEYVAWGWNPWIAPVSNAADLAWTGKFWGEELDQRAGTVHMGFGTSYGAQNYNFTLEHGIPVNHYDLYLMRPTLTADGKVLIDAGHLTLLDDPEIRAMAAKYGDPDEILRERWHPDQDPRYRDR